MTTKLAMLVLAGLAFPALAPAAFAQDPDPALVAAGEKVFKRCAACHMIGPEAKNRVGPSLEGVIGRTAGTGADYDYSAAMVEAGAGGLVWSDEILHTYLENPKALVPGTKMAFTGLRAEKDRDAVIAYIDASGGKE